MHGASLRRDVLFVFADEIPKPSRVNDLDRSVGSDIQEVSIAGHEHICAALDCGGQDPLVIGVAFWNRGSCRWFRSYLVFPQKLLNLGDGLWRQPDSLPEYPPQFSQHHVACYKRVFGKYNAQYIRADSAGCEGANQDVRVQENPQEISRATSSSVKYPRASANGSALRRSRSNLSRLNCRRRASRTTSLRFRPVCLQYRLRSFSRSGSRRIVTADCMSYNVLQGVTQGKWVE